jgi:hypothetical protein
VSDIESRVKKLEQQTGADKPESKTWVVVKGEPRPDGIADGDTVIRVLNAETKENVLRVMAGERT